MKNIVLSAALSSLLLAPVTLLAGPNDAITQRQHLMEETRDAVKPIGGMAKGEVAFDAAVVAESLAVLERVAAEYGNYFPPGSDTGHDTEARPEIWTDRAGFDARLVDFADAVAAGQTANPQSLEELKPVAGAIFKSCKGCHENYRVEKD